MPRVDVFTGSNGCTYASFECPGCGFNHGPVIARTDGQAHPMWTWNNDLERPTFAPSLLVQYGDKSVCHSFVRDGRIEFLSDCTHALAGQTVDLPEVES